MRDAYTQLLEATIQHLETLKARGLQFVTVSPQTLQALQAEPAITNRRSAAGFRGEAVRSSPARRTAQTEVSPAQKSGVKAGTELSPTQERTQPIAKEDQRTPLSAEAKTAAFAELRQRVMPCTKCAHLASSRKNVVFGVGDINARLLFVGEAPGADEDEQEEPFVGKAGQLLTRIIQTMGLSRSSVYIANILKCRPDTPGQASGNRKPTAEEMQTCIPFLHEQIDLIAPKVIVALGATAVEGLLGKTIGITRLRGQWRMYRGVPLMPTYHPAYLLRNQALSEKRRVWEDMLQVMERLELPISEKQRNFFLK
ncbi:MAG TPA: uracil-DNA glycosylase [Patescibacteria group bacterium]|nr:uracil-DNA glycosylase [Patescibacteria group bacterium]